MIKRFLQIDGSKSHYEPDDEDLIKIKIGNENIHQFNFLNFSDKYSYTEALIAIHNKIYEIEDTVQIKEESIKLFLQFIRDEKVSLPIEHFRDVYILSEYFKITKLTLELNNISQKELFKDLTLIIQVLFDLNSFKGKFETSLTNKIESFLSSQINECFKNPNFSRLPVSTIYRILNITNKETIDFNLLVDFITNSLDYLFILFEFVEIQKVTDDNIEKIIKLTEDTQKRMAFNSVPLNLMLIKRMKNENDNLVEELNQTKQELEQTKKEMNRTREELEKTKQEMKQAKEELERVKRKKILNRQGRK